ncbi:MAG: fumarylacetoacetate hydrolase family protein [Puia sp.]
MKIFCVGRNYVAHAIELNNEVPDEPVIFMKPKSALLQAHTPFYYPEFTNELHYECELVLRISKNGKYIQDRFASKYYDAISVGIDCYCPGYSERTEGKRTSMGESKSLG